MRKDAGDGPLQQPDARQHTHELEQWQGSQPRPVGGKAERQEQQSRKPVAGAGELHIVFQRHQRLPPRQCRYQGLPYNEEVLDVAHSHEQAHHAQNPVDRVVRPREFGRGGTQSLSRKPKKTVWKILEHQLPRFAL